MQLQHATISRANKGVFVTTWVNKIVDISTTRTNNYNNHWRVT